MADALLPPSIHGDPRSQQFADLAARLTAIDLTPLLVYLIDLVDETALDALSWQFHVDSMASGWPHRRQAIKESIEIHRRKGTPYAIKRALSIIGYPDSRIVESWMINKRHDATYRHDGMIRHDGLQFSHWAEFDVILYATTRPDAAAIERIRRVISDAAPVRCRLRRIYLNTLRHDGQHRHDGVQKHDGALLWLI